MSGRAHRLRGTILLALPLCVLVAVAVQAETLTYEHDGAPLFSIEIPDGWVADLDFEQEAREAGIPEGEEPKFRVVEISPVDESHVWLGVWSIPEVETLDAGAEYLASLGQDLFTDLEISGPEQTEHNGMAVRTWTGAARRDGKPVELAMALFEPRSGAIAAALYVGEEDAWQKYSEELEAMVKSVEPAGD